MYIKDPTKRVQYTFRVKEDLMEDLKAYAKAKDQKLPRILNDMISEYLDGMNLSNTWLREELGAFITIPNDIITTKIYPINLLDNDKDGLKYEIKAMPNNMAIWNDKYGYISKNHDVLYEGIEPMLIPGLMEDLTLTADKDTARSIAKCLFGIHILQYDNGQIKVELVTITIATKMLESVNKDMAKMFVNYRTMLNREINNALTNLNEVNHDKVKEELLEKMEELAVGINTGNLEPITGNKIVYDSIKMITATNNDKDINALLTRNPYLANQELQQEIDQLKKENKELHERIDKINEILDKTAPIVERMQKVDGVTLEEVKKEYD